MENRVVLTGQPLLVSVTTKEPTRFQLQPQVPRSFEQIREPVYRDQSNFLASRSQPSYVQRSIPQYAISMSIATYPNPAPPIYSQPTKQGRSAGPITSMTAVPRQHGPAMQPTASPRTRCRQIRFSPNQTTADRYFGAGSRSPRRSAVVRRVS